MTSAEKTASRDWKSLSAESRVWIYQANRGFSDQEVEQVNIAGKAFVAQWASHGTELHGAFEVFHNRFIVLFADETKASASGCSIDSSVHFVQSLGAEFGIDFFDRMTICYLDGEEVKTVKLGDIPISVKKGELTAETFFFDNLVPDQAAFQSRWKTKMSQGWLSRYL